jgi:hypothetical protein
MAVVGLTLLLCGVMVTAVAHWKSCRLVVMLLLPFLLLIVCVAVAPAVVVEMLDDVQVT